MTQLAIIKTGGKQYIVSPGQKIKIEKLEEEKPETQASAKRGRGDKVSSLTQAECKRGEASRGDKVSSPVIFNEVLLLEKDEKIEIGTPLVKGVKVIGKILKQDKAKKVIVFKYKSKKRSKVKKGHRQPYTEVEITKFQIPNNKQ